MHCTAHFEEVALRKLITACCLVLALPGCAGLNQPTEAALSAPKRVLTVAERSALAATLSRSLKDPTAAQFKWMPIVLSERDGITDYCGLVNGKNSYGGYTGFVRFYAHLTKDKRDQFTAGTMRAVEEPNREHNPLDPRWLNGICESFGYSNFEKAE
jgi:hypothetical protein